MRVLDGDANVAGQRFQQLHIFVGEEVAFHALAQTQDGNHPALYGAGDVIVQIELRDGVLGSGGFAQRLPGIVKKQMACQELRAIFAQKAEVEGLG